MSSRNARAVGLGLAALVFALDQAIKWLMIGPLQLQLVRQITIVPIFNLTYTENYGVSLGLFTAQSEAMRWGLVGVTSAIALFVLIWLLREKRLADIAGLGLILGGALGNILDRSTIGYVIDYADLHFGEWRPFLIFNLADAAITVGLLIVLARSFLSREKRAEDEPPQGAPAGSASES